MSGTSKDGWHAGEMLRKERYLARAAAETTPEALARKIEAASGALTFLDFTHPLVFRDGTYRWVGLKRFHIDASLAPTALFAALLDDPEYRDTYITFDAVTTYPVHGPYRLDALTLDGFEQIGASRGLDVFRAWADERGPVAVSEMEGDPAVVESLIESSDERFFLPDLGDDARHETGWILNPFLELVLIHRERRELLLVVLTDD